jgi:hypothetical protein
MRLRWLGLFTVCALGCTALSDGDGSGARDASDLDGAMTDEDEAGTDRDARSGDGDGESCEPLSKRTCYTGLEGTIGHGVCKAGKQACNEEGTAYGPCEGEVVPRPAACSEQLRDLDCNDVPDNAQDLDGDG